MSSKKTTVWILNGAMNAGGTESLIMELLRNKPNTVDVRLVIHSSSGDFSGVYDDEIKALNIPVSHLPAYGAVGYKSYARAFNSLVEEVGLPDVIHSNMNAVGGFIAKVAKKAGVKSRIVHCHADIKYRGSKLSIIKSELALAVMKTYVNRYANNYWACSDAAARRLFYKNKKTVVIPNVIDVEKYLSSPEKKLAEKALLGVDKNALIVGAVGRIAPIKNYEVIIKAIQKLKSNGKNVHFIVYGRAADENYFNSLKNLADELGVVENVHFLGNSTRISDAISAFDVFVMPSITEGLGISALEAQAAGIPTVLSNGVPSETDMGLSLISRADANDVDAWANAIENANVKAVDSEEIIKAFNEKGYNSKTKCGEIYTAYEKMKAEGI